MTTPSPTPRVLNIRPVTDHAAIKAFFDVTFDEGVVVRDWMLFEGPNGRWFAPQGIPQIDADGRHRVVGGKRQYTRHITFDDTFKETVLAQLAPFPEG
jgi:hypothetical protein